MSGPSRPDAPAGPVRTCVGCRCPAAKADLVRVIVTDGILTVSATGPGRGAYLHADPACWRSAIRRRALGRALRAAGIADLTEQAGRLAQTFAEGIQL